MAVFDSTHGGGSVGRVTVTDTGLTIVANKDVQRGYFIVTASRNNAGPVFLRLHDTEPAVYEAGVPLWPGDSYEINKNNLTFTAIRAACAPGTEEILYWQNGR